MVAETASLVDGGCPNNTNRLIKYSKTMSLLQFKLIITSMLFSYGSGQQQIDNNEKCK